MPVFCDSVRSQQEEKHFLFRSPMPSTAPTRGYQGSTGAPRSRAALPPQSHLPHCRDSSAEQSLTPGRDPSGTPAEDPRPGPAQPHGLCAAGLGSRRGAQPRGSARLRAVQLRAAPDGTPRSAPGPSRSSGAPHRSGPKRAEPNPAPSLPRALRAAPRGLMAAAGKVRPSAADKGRAGAGPRRAGTRGSLPEERPSRS